MGCDAPDDVAPRFLREHMQIVIEDLCRGGHLWITAVRNGLEREGSRPRSVRAVQQLASRGHLKDVEVPVGDDRTEHVFVLLTSRAQLRLNAPWPASRTIRAADDFLNALTDSG
jgi:hypothetical protein